MNKLRLSEANARGISLGHEVEDSFSRATKTKVEESMHWRQKGRAVVLELEATILVLGIKLRIHRAKPHRLEWR